MNINAKNFKRFLVHCYKNVLFGIGKNFPKYMKFICRIFSDVNDLHTLPLKTNFLSEYSIYKKYIQYVPSYL